VTANDSKWKEDIRNNVLAKQKPGTSKWSLKDLITNESALLAFYKEDPNNFTLLAGRMSGLVVSLMESAKQTQEQAGTGVDQQAMAASQLESKYATEEATPEKYKATHQGSVVMAVTPAENKDQTGAQPNQMTTADHQQQDNNVMGSTAGETKSTSTEATPEKSKAVRQGFVVTVTPAENKNQIGAQPNQITTADIQQQENNGMSSTAGETKSSSTDKTAPAEDVTPHQDQERADPKSYTTSRNNLSVERHQTSKAPVSF
jgi:hypothetical protein